MAMLSLKSVFGSYWIQKQSFVLDTPSQCSWPPDAAPEAAQKIDVELIRKKKEADALWCGANGMIWSYLFDLAAQ